MGWRARITAGTCSTAAVSAQVRLPATRRRKVWRNWRKVTGCLEDMPRLYGNVRGLEFGAPDVH